MAGTRRSTRSSSSVVHEPPLPTPSRNVRTRASSKAVPQEGSDKENTPPKHTNTQVTGEANGKNSTPPQMQQEICGICLDAVNTVKGSLPVCVHIFCFECIHQWSKTSNTCPMCKAKFRMINRAEPGKGRKPKRVRVSDVDQRPDYSDPDPDDFLTDDEEDSGDDIIFYGASMFSELEDGWMDTDDGEFPEDLLDTEDEEEDEELEAEVVDEDAEEEEEGEEEEEDEGADWDIQIAHATAMDSASRLNGFEEDSDYDEDCILQDAPPVTRSRSRASTPTRTSSRATRSTVIAVDEDEDEDADEEDEETEEVEAEGEVLRRSTRLRDTPSRLTSSSSSRGTRPGRVVIDIDSDDENVPTTSNAPDYVSSGSDADEEVIRTINTRSRSYPGSLSNNHNHHTHQNHNHNANHHGSDASSNNHDDNAVPRLTRSRSRNGAASASTAANETHTRVTRNNTRTTRRNATTTNNHHTNNNNNNGNNNNNANNNYTDPEDSPAGRRGKRARKSPTRFGFQANLRGATTATTTTTTTWNHTEQEQDNEMEEDDNEATRYNLRSLRRNASAPDRMED